MNKVMGCRQLGVEMLIGRQKHKGFVIEEKRTVSRKGEEEARERGRQRLELSRDYRFRPFHLS
jgi:hypothetical protein